MNTTQITTYLLWFAAFTQAMVMLSGIIAPKKLNYAKSIAAMESFPGQVFKVYAFYILLVLFFMSVALILYPGEFMASRGIGKGLQIYHAIFWTIRLYNQLFYYKAEIKRTYPVYNVLFTLGFVYLSGLFITLSIFF